MVGSFTNGVSVYDGMPYAGVTDLELLAVEAALRLVWAESSKRFHCHKIDFCKANEDQISSALVSVFANILKGEDDRKLLSNLAKVFQPQPEFNSQYGAADYLGKALTFRPDLTFRRVYTPPGMDPLNSCLFVEAKVMDQNKKMGNYCGDGLIRFVNGTYAWAMPQAIMLGYLKQTDQQLPGTLAAHFRRRGKRALYNLENGPTAFPLSPFADRTYVTVHDRTWTYPETNGSPGPIKVLHLWLTVA